jgi:hypothetical protein
MMKAASSGEGLANPLKKLYGEDRFHTQYERLQQALSILDGNSETGWNKSTLNANGLDQMIQESRFEEWQHPISVEFHLAQYLSRLINGEIVPWKENRGGGYTRGMGRWHDEVTDTFNLGGFGSIRLFYIPETKKFRICNGHMRTNVLISLLMEGGLDLKLDNPHAKVLTEVELFTTEENFRQRSADLNTSFRTRREFLAIRQATLKEHPNFFDRQGAVS